jgi:hypothetical protein
MASSSLHTHKPWVRCCLTQEQTTRDQGDREKSVHHFMMPLSTPWLHSQFFLPNMVLYNTLQCMDFEPFLQTRRGKHLRDQSANHGKTSIYIPQLTLHPFINRMLPVLWEHHFCWSLTSHRGKNVRPSMQTSIWTLELDWMQHLLASRVSTYMRGMKARHSTRTRLDPGWAASAKFASIRGSRPIILIRLGGG